MIKGLFGNRVSSVRALASGFKVQGLGFRVSGLEFRVQGLGFGPSPSSEAGI